MKPSVLLTSLIGDQPFVAFAFGDAAEQGITDMFFDPKRRSELFPEPAEHQSLAGLGLQLDQQKALVPGLCPLVITRTKIVVADKDFPATVFQGAETERLGEVDWEHQHGFCSEQGQRLLVRRLFQKLQGRFRNENFLHAKGHNGGSTNFFPVRRGDRFAFAFFSLASAPADQAAVTA